MRRSTWRLFGTPAVVALLASLLLAVPFVVAATIRSSPERAPAPRFVSRAAALPSCTIIGTPGADILIGTPGRDVICALGGDDTVRGRGGDDVLFGSTGDDSISGGTGNDRVYGHFGADRLAGGQGRDFLQGGGDRDLISGGSGSDIADYGERILPVRVSIGRGANDGRQGERDDVRRDVERVRGGHAGDTLIGNRGANTLRGGGGDDSLNGKRGDDRLRGGSGVDRLDGRDDNSFEDSLRCGPGTPDKALADAPDHVASDCEGVDQPEPRNHPPTNIRLSSDSVAEGQPAGTVVGTLSATDQDAGDSHTFALIAGDGDTDNGSFAIVGDQLRTAAVFDFETKSSYSIRVRVRDERGAAFQKAFTITITDLSENHAPTNITLSPAAVVENLPGGTTVGSFATTDADAGDTHSYVLVAGAGGTDNAAFTISGDQLKTAQVFDFETKSSYSIRVRTTDSGSPALSFTKAFTVTVTDVNDAPHITTSAGAMSYTEGDAATVVDGGLTVTDADDASIDSAKVEIVSGFQAADELPFSDQNGITGTYDSGTGVLTLSGTSSVANYEAALRSVEYRHTGDDPATSKGVQFTANDGDADSAAAVKSITVTPVNDAPTVETSSGAASWTEGGGPVAVDDGITVSDPDSTQLAGATVTLTSNFNSAQDLLDFAAQLGISGGYDAGTGELTLSGAASLAAYQAVLRSVSYGNSSDDPDAATRTVSFQVTDAAAADSNAATRDVTIVGTNDAPTIATTAAALAYTEGDPATDVDIGLAVTDPDDANLEGATVRISVSFEPGDVLVFTNQNGITGSYNAGTGVLTMTGTSSVASYQTALRTVGFRTTSDTPALAKTVEFRADDGDGLGAAATRDIHITPVNDAPVATPGTRTTDEDTPLTLDLAPLASDVETDDANLTYEIVDQPAHGSATATTYTPEPDFNGSDSFTFKVTDRGDPDNCSSAPCDAPLTSSTETVSITVDPVNDAPVATAGDRTTDEDTPLGLDLAALVSDVETANANLTYEIVSQPAHGSATATTYTPDQDFNGSDSLTFKVTDRGDPDNCSSAPCDAPLTSSTETVSITVNAVNDAPVNLLPAGPLSVVEDTDAPIAGVSIADVDAGDDEFALQLEVDHGTLTIDTAVFGGVGALQVAGNGTAQVQIVASLTHINATLADPNGLVYHPAGGYTGPDTLTVDSSDQGHNGAGGPLMDSDTLAIDVVPPNAAPVAAAQSVSTNEDAAKTITLSASDADGDDPLTLAKGTLPTHGSLGAIGAVTCNHLTPNVCTADVVYTPDADYNGPDSFTFTANDGTVDSAAATVSITVDAVNDVPQLANIEGGALAYTENDPATLLTATATVTDIDSPDFDTGTLTVDYSNGGTADDRLEIRNEGTGAGQIGVSGSNVTFGGTTIGTFTGGTGTTPLVVTLNVSSTPAAAQALVRNITYRNVSDAPSTAARTARFVLTDGDGGTSAPATRGIALTAVDDPPALAGIEAGALAYTENDPATAVTSTLTVTDPDSNITGATVSITANLAAGEDVLSFVNQLGITGSYNAATGVLTLSGSTTPANYQTALRGVKYADTSEDPSTLTRTISFAVQGGAAPVTRDVTVTAVNDAPVADDETFNGASSAVGNTTLAVNDPDDGAPATPDPTDTSPVSDRPHKTISGDILAGDTDADGPGPLTVTPGAFATNDGGTVTLQADGDFTFEPAPSTSCTDTSDFFDYTVSDQNAAGPGPTPGTDNGRVTIAISGCVWYVDNDDAQGNSGTSEKPFDTLAQAETASGTGHSIFVYDGNNTTSGYATGINLKANQKLIGEAATLTVGSDTLHSADAANKPTITDNDADVIELDDSNEVRGFNIDPQGTGGGIAGTAGDTGGGTIDDVNITDAGTAGSQAGLELNGTTGTFNVSNFVLNNSATGVLLNNAGTVNFASAGTISITSAGAKGLDATGTNMGTSTFDAITVTGSAGGGVSMTTTSGTTTFGDLALTTTSGSAPGFALSNAGTVTVPAGGTANVNATGGPAVDVTGTSGAALDFDAVSSTNSANDGINIAGLGTGGFTATSGTIAGAAGIAFDLDGGSGTVTYPGPLNNGAGATAEITNRGGGSVTLSGAISDTNDAGGGITVSGNTAGSTTFSGSAKTLNTGASQAVTLSSNTGHTIAFTNGGLDIDTTSGAGFSATGGGTVTVSGSGNAVSSGTGTGLNVANTTIGASGLTLESVSANGAASGIVLNNTGATAGLTVTGTASANSGGTIQNTSSHGIALTDTRSVSLNRMNIQNTAGSGVRGTTGVNGFSFTNGTVNNSGTGGGNQESSIAFNDPTGSATDAKVTGTVTITGNTLTNARWHGVSILQFAGTLDDVNISNNVLTSGTTTGAGGNSFGSGIQLVPGGVASSVATVTRAELNNNTITNFPGGVLIAAQCGTANGSGPTGVCGTPGSATNDIEIKNNFLNGGGTTPDGVGGFILPNQLMLLTVNGRGQGQFTVQNNGSVGDPLSGSIGNNIDISAGGAVTVQATVTGNQMDAAGQSVSGTSGIAAGVGPFTVTGPTTLSTATLYATVQNNGVKNSSGSGIRLNVNAGSPTLNGVVTNNTVTTPLSATYGIQVVEGNNAGFTGHANVQVSGNTSTGGTGGGNTFPGIGLRKFGTATNEFSIVGLSPSPATNAQMELYVAGINTSTPGTFGTNGVAAVNGSSNNWTAIGAVPQPPALP